MSNINYPPNEIIHVSGMEKRNYEHIILWMFYNNEKCEWSNFIQEPLEIPSSTLSRYLNMLKSEGFIISFKKGHYRITSDGERRFHELSKKKEKKRILNFPPDVILKSGRNYDHWILWMVYNNNYCRWSNFLEEPLSINQTSLLKYLRILIKEGLIKKDEEKKEYRITHKGKVEYSYMLQNYNLDRQSILKQESRRIEDITQKTIEFYNKFNINDENIQFRLLNNILKLDYGRVESLLRNEENFKKILLFISINHPNEYPNYINTKKFSQIYRIKENTLTYYVDQIVENQLYPIKFFKFKVPPNKTYYFQENEKLESMLRAITEEYITKITYLNKLFSRERNSDAIVEGILVESCEILFNKGLKKSLKEFLPNYINYLAFKIEAERELKETYDKLEGIIWQNMPEIFKPETANSIENQYREEIREIDEQIKVNPNNIELYFTKIRIVLHLGQFDNALDLLNKLIEIFPEDTRDILIKKASILKRINEIEAGLKIIDELLEENPNDSELLVYKAYWLQYLNKKEQSLQIIDNLIETNPENGLYYDTYGEILMYSQDYKLAIEKFEKVIELVSDEWYINQTYIKLGICYKELKDNNLAIKYLKKGKELTRSASMEYEIKEKWLKIVDIFLKEIEEL